MNPGSAAPGFDITFRPLSDEDLPLLHGWLNDPAVVRWWEGRDVSWEAVAREYGSKNTDPFEHYLALLDSEPLGWIQCYGAHHTEEEETHYWRDHVDLEQTAGIDYLVGNPRHRGRGVGSAMIRCFVEDVVFGRHPDWAFAAAGPFEANLASWKALERAGFQRMAVLDDDEGPCVLMVVARADFSTE